MHIRFHALFVERARLVIIHFTVEVVLFPSSCTLASFPSSISCVIPFILHMFLSSMNLSSFGVSLVALPNKISLEIRAVWQPGFLNTTRFGPDVVLTTICCHEDGPVNLLIVKSAHGKTGRYLIFVPLHVHLFSGPHKCPSPSTPTVHNPQVTPTTTGPPKVALSVNQTIFCVTLLCSTLVRDRASQEIVGLHFWYCSMVVHKRWCLFPVPRATQCMWDVWILQL